MVRIRTVAEEIRGADDLGIQLGVHLAGVVPARVVALREASFAAEEACQLARVACKAKPGNVARYSPSCDRDRGPPHSRIDR